MRFSKEAYQRAVDYLEEIAGALGEDVNRDGDSLLHKELGRFLRISEMQNRITSYRSTPSGRLYVTVEIGYGRQAKKFYEKKGQLDIQAVIEYCREYVKSKLDSDKRDKYIQALKEVSEAELNCIKEKLGPLYGVHAVLLKDGSPGAEFKLRIPASQLEEALELFKEKGWSI